MANSAGGLFVRKSGGVLARRLLLGTVLLVAGTTGANAAVCQLVQSGTAVNNTNGIQTITISSVDTTKSILIFQARSSGNRPVNAEVRGRLGTATTIEFERVTDEGTPAAINIQWYVVTFGSGVRVQRGETTQSGTTTNVTISAVASLSQAFVLWSKTPVAGDNAWGSDDSILGELTATTNLQFRANALNAGHIIAWQVVEFTNSADINVQKGTTSLTGAATSVTATLGTAVNTSKTFVLVGARTTDGSGPDIGAKLVRAQLTNSTTITIDRSAASTSDVTEIVWQAIELKDASTVWRGTANFTAGSSQTTAALGNPFVNPSRAVAFISTQTGGGQNTGRTSYVGDDVVGVSAATASFTSNTLTLNRDSTAAAADVAWFVVQFDGGSPFKVGSFTTSTSSGTQTIAHGLGQVPKALILWTEGRTDQTFSNSNIAFRAAASAGATSGVLTLTINKPAGTTQNDVMVASIGIRPNTAVITAPSGWTLLRRTDNINANPNSLAVYYRVAGGSEPASYAWTFDTSTGSVGGIASFSGVDTNNPIDVEGGQNTANALTHAAPAVTTTKANTMVVTAHSFSSSATWTAPGGMTEAVDVASDALGSGGQSLEMAYAIQAAVGSTGTLTATAANDADVGNAQTIALIPAARAYFGFGMTDGTTSKSISAASQGGAAASNTANRVANKAITIVKWNPSGTATLLAEADLASWDDTNITLNWTTNDAYSYVVHYLAIGGTDVSAKVVQWQMGTTTGNVAVTGVGFEPVLVFHANAGFQQTAAPNSNASRAAFGFGAMDFDGDQWAVSFFSRDGIATGDTQRGQLTDACIYAFNQGLVVQKKASFVSMDADGFTVNFSNSTSGNNAQVFSLALGGLNASVGSFNKATGAAPANQSITGVDFRPSAVLLTSFQDVAQSNPVAHSRFGIGASDGTTQGSSALEDQDGVTPTNMVGIDKTTKVFMKMNNGTPAIDAEADLTSMDVDGFTLRWTTNDAVQTQILYFALAPLAATEVRLISFTATKYDRGTLLQWRTGYEVDNLGFNLYREVGGVRTKINSSLIAGSGLMAGQGAAVTSEQRYARWDVAPASGPVLYWLEDVEFGGRVTLHGPITPSPGELQAPNVVISGDVKDIGKRTDNPRVLLRHNDDLASGERERSGWNNQPQSQIETQWALAAQPAVKIGIRAPGWYRVGQPELTQAGLDPGADPRMLRLFVKGVEQSMRVTGDADGTFDAGDAIEFYATGQDTPSTDAHVYWLVAGNRPGLRIRTLDFAGDAEGPAGASNFWSTVQRKDRSVYFAALKNGDAENWFGPVVSADPTDLTLNLDHIDGTAAAPAQLTVAVQGVTTSADGSAEHAVGVLVNGVDVGELRFQGQGHPQNTFDVPASALIEGTNTVTLVARGGEVDLSLLDFIRVSYWHTFTADADLLRFTVNRPGRVTVSGFASPSIHVVDITNTCAVKELSGAVSTDASGSSSITVGVTVQGERTLLAYSDATAAVPAYIEPNTPSTWHLPTEAHDYVIITHRDFADAVQPLIERRTQEGHNAATIVLDDVYDEFSYGEKSPQAIRDFLQWANTNWEFAPRFVVLVGDATIDPRDYAGLGDADFVPTKQVPMTQIALESASDDWFVDFNDDGLPEIAIGRLPVRTPEHAQSMIAKIVGYGTGAVQSWAQQVMLVADRNDDTSDFEQYSRNLTSVLPSGYTAHEVFRGTLGDAVAHEALLDGVNEGRLIVNYSGHGSTRIWGSNGELLTNEGVADWQNTDRLPFVVAMNCLNGLFDSVWDEESLAEALMRAPNTGAVAAWASSSVTPSATQSLINAELFRLIFAGRYATLGEAVVAAKGAVSKSDLRRSWIFFGDPAMQLVGVPRPIVDTTTPPTPVVDEPTTPPPAPTAEQLAALDARGRPLRLRDLSGDGRADMYLYAVETGNWSAVINTGSDSPLLRSGTWAAGWQVLAADLDGNGRADLMFCKPATGEWVQAFATSDDGFVYTQGTMPAGGARAQLAVGDFNADKRDDVLVYDAESGRWTIAVSDGRGNFTYRRGTWPAGLRTIVADFDGNKRADVFGYDATSGHAVLEMSRRDEQFQAVPSSWPAGLRVSVGRLDRNSSSDLFFYNPATGDWQAAFNDGSGGFTSRSGSLPAGLEIHLGDLDGDRVDDLFGYNPATGETVTGLNAAPGDFAVTTTYWAVGFSVATGDVDGDGRVDVALYDPATGVWFQCTSMGSGVFAFSSGTWLSNAAFVGSPR